MGSSARAAFQAFGDFTVWLLAVPIAFWLRFDFSTPPGDWGTALLWGAGAGLAHVLVGYARQLYRGRYRFGSFDEVSGVVFSVTLVTVAWELAVLIVQPQDLPRTIPLIAGGLLSFTLCLDNTIISSLISGASSTFPVALISATKSEIKPFWGVGAVVLFVMTMALLAFVAKVLKKSGDSSSQIAATLAGG